MLTDIRSGRGGPRNSGELWAMRLHVPCGEHGWRSIHRRRQHAMVDIWDSAVVADLIEAPYKRRTLGLFCPMHDDAGH